MRRQQLLALVNLEKYISENFTNLYYDLIDGKKAKLIEYDGNSVSENQIAKLDLKTDTFTGGSAISVPNSYFSSYTQGNDGMTFTTVAFTKQWNLG